jgi:hypothetical protein
VKDYRLTIRLSSAEKEHLEALSQDRQLDKSELMRYLLNTTRHVSPSLAKTGCFRPLPLPTVTFQVNLSEEKQHGH